MAPPQPGRNRWWLVKQEPEDFPWEQLVRERGTLWTGVRNFQARNNLRAMQPGDAVFYYHSGAAREIVGVAEVGASAIPDPTAEEGDWSAIRILPVRPLPVAVSLKAIKANPNLAGLALVRHSRLSVMPVGDAEAEELLRMASR
jgi:predicted RNA-binding protein with PUA-like domain